MDADALIEHVYARNAIWDKRVKNHSNRTVVDGLWKDIAWEMEYDGKKFVQFGESERMGSYLKLITRNHLLMYKYNFDSNGLLFVHSKLQCWVK